MAVWGFNLSALVVLVKNIDPITLTSARIFTAGIAVLIVAKIMGFFRLPSKSEWKTIGLITIFNVAFHHTFLAIGLTKTSGVNAGIILGAAPLVTMVLSIVFLRDQVTRLRTIGFFLGFIGIIITSVAGTGGISAISLGDGYIFLSMFFQAISFILISKLDLSFDSWLLACYMLFMGYDFILISNLILSFDPLILTSYMLILVSISIFIVAVGVEQNVSQLSQLFSIKLGLVFSFSAIIATAFGHMISNYAIRNVGPTETTIFVNLNTMFAILGAALFLGEPILMKHYTGLGFIIIGVFIGSGTLDYILRKRRRRA